MAKQPKRPRKQIKRVPKQTKPEETEQIQTPQLETTMIDSGEDRMLRYRRNPQCPKCGAHPVICTIRRISYRAFRCRICGHRWEVFD